MAIYSGFFNSVNNDRLYDAAWFAKYFSLFIGNGIFPNPSTGLQVVEGDNMTTVVKPGDGWINGYFISNDADYTLEHDIADGVLSRIDRVIMQLDYSNRTINIGIKKGAFSSDPTPPVISRDQDYHELVLADVFIGYGTTNIIQSDITDTRLDDELCGIVHGTVEQVDTTTLYNQYLDFWNNWRTQQMNEFEQFQTDAQDAFDTQYQTNQQTFDNQTIMNQQEFDEWFNDTRSILDGDVAGNLLNLITANTNAINDVETNLENLITANTNLENLITANTNAINDVETNLENHEKKKGTETDYGHVKADGETIVSNDGVISAQIVDSVTSDKWQWKIENGLAFLEKVGV